MIINMAPVAESLSKALFIRVEKLTLRIHSFPGPTS